MTQIINIPAADAVAIASLAAFTANPKDTAPVLSEIDIEIRDGELVAHATDRYTLAQYRAQIQAPDARFRLSPIASKFLAANVKKLNKWTSPAPVEFAIDTDARELVITYQGATLRDGWRADKFPPVYSLIESWEPALEAKPVKFRAAFLARLGKLVDAFSKSEEWIIQTGLGTSELARESGKPGPMMATAGNFRVLIQPMIMTTE